MEFVDTNVVVYAFSNDPLDREKAKRANTILDSRGVGLSVQVLQEFYVQVTRPTREHRLTHDQARDAVESLRLFPIQAVTPELVRAAIDTRERFLISYWDAAIIEAARMLGCDVVLSEDLGDGQDYGGVRVRNPFGGEV